MEFMQGLAVDSQHDLESIPSAATSRTDTTTTTPLHQRLDPYLNANIGVASAFTNGIASVALWALQRYKATDIDALVTSQESVVK